MTAMASTTIVFGILLTLLGLVGYAMSRTSMTALIPSLFGLLLLILGFLARLESIRKHAMHAAAAVALIGCVGALIPLLRTPSGVRPAIAVFSQVAMVVLTAVFVALCVRSFIAARRARRSA
jgi:uncharacterized membrane protein